MNNNSDAHFIIMKSVIESNKEQMIVNKPYSDEKIMNITEDFNANLTTITDQINTLKYSPTHKHSPKPPDPTTVVRANRRDPPLDGGQSTQIGGMWTLKHEISSPKFYKIPIKK